MTRNVLLSLVLDLPAEYQEHINQYKILRYNKLYDKVNYAEEVFEWNVGA